MPSATQMRRLKPRFLRKQCSDSEFEAGCMRCSEDALQGRTGPLIATTMAADNTSSAAARRRLLDSARGMDVAFRSKATSARWRWRKWSNAIKGRAPRVSGQAYVEHTYHPASDNLEQHRMGDDRGVGDSAARGILSWQI